MRCDAPAKPDGKAGDGKKFKRDMQYMIDSIRKVVPKIFLSEDYKDRHSRIVREFENRQKDLVQTFEDKLTAAGFVMVQIQSGMGVRNEIQPLIDEEPASLEKLERLVKEGKFAAAQLDVEEDELGRRALDGLQGVGHALGLAHDLDLGMGRQQASHCLARQMLVIDDQDPEQGSPSSMRVAITVLRLLLNVNL